MHDDIGTRSIAQRVVLFRVSDPLMDDSAKRGGFITCFRTFYRDLLRPLLSFLLKGNHEENTSCSHMKEL